MENIALTFSEALEKLKNGEKVTRKGWHWRGMWIELQLPDENSKMTKPYIFMSLPKSSPIQFTETTNEIERVPWLASQTDLLSNDWIVI